MMVVTVPLAAGRPPKPVINAGVAPLLARGHVGMTGCWMRKCFKALAAGQGRYLRLTAVAVAAWIAAGAASAGGYYLRGGIGFDRPGDTAFTDVDCASSAPAALYGCGRDSAGFPRRSLGDFGTPASLELGLGYDTGSAARLEFLVEYRPGFTFEGQANFLAPDRQQSVAAESPPCLLTAYGNAGSRALPPDIPETTAVDSRQGAAGQGNQDPCPGMCSTSRALSVRSAHMQMECESQSGPAANQVSIRSRILRALR